MVEGNAFHSAGAAGGEGVYRRVRGTTLMVAGHRIHVLPCISILSVVVILIGGALAFQHIEQPAARAEAEEYLKVKASLEAAFAEMPQDHQVLLQQYLKLIDKYLNTRATAPDWESVNWNFMGSLYFCVTVVTTIGYGTYTPITESGKTLLLFYALIGIPSFVVFLTVMSDALLGTVRAAVKDLMFSSVEKGIFRSTPGVSVSSVTIAVLGIFTAVFVLIWSFAFAIYNGWTYLDSVYFGVVTVTTVGFGDFSPDTGDVMWVEHLLYMLYFVFGLISMATLIAAIQKKVTEHQASIYRARMKRPDPGTPTSPGSSAVNSPDIKLQPMPPSRPLQLIQPIQPLADVAIKDAALTRMASEILSDFDSSSDVDPSETTQEGDCSIDQELVDQDSVLSDGKAKAKAKPRKKGRLSKSSRKDDKDN